MPAIKLIRVSVLTGSILFLFLIGNIFNSGVKWDLLDFLIAGSLLFTAGTIAEWILAGFSSRTRRWLFLALLMGILLLIWAEMAVGIFSTPLAGS